LIDTPYIANSDLYLCPQVRLLADAPGVDSFVFDGTGHKLFLPPNMTPLDSIPLILVGTNKQLTLKNVTIVYSSSFSSVIQLKSGKAVISQYWAKD